MCVDANQHELRIAGTTNDILQARGVAQRLGHRGGIAGAFDSDHGQGAATPACRRPLALQSGAKVARIRQAGLRINRGVLQQVSVDRRQFAGEAQQVGKLWRRKIEVDVGFQAPPEMRAPFGGMAREIIAQGAKFRGRKADPSTALQYLGHAGLRIGRRQIGQQFSQPYRLRNQLRSNPGQWRLVGQFGVTVKGGQQLRARPPTRRRLTPCRRRIQPGGQKDLFTVGQ